MATAAEKKAAVDLLVEEGVIAEAEAEDEPTKEELDRELSLSNWIADLGGVDDAAIIVYRIREKDNKQVYIDSLGAQEMDGPGVFQKLKNEYGGGKFRIQLRGNGRIQKTQTIEIEPPPKQPPGGELGGMNLAGIIRELKTTKDNDSTELILNMMQSQNAQFQQMVTTLIAAMGNNSNQPVVDPMAMQTSLLEGIATMQKLAGVNDKAKDPTQLILEGVKLVSAIKESGEGGEANIYSLLSKAVDGFGETLTTAMALNPSATPVAPPQLTAQPSSLAAIADAHKTDPEKAPVLGQPTLPPDHPLAPFEPFVDWMLSLAHKQANPELYAEVIIDQIGSETAHAWLATDEGIAALKENLPKTVPYENWLRAVGREIVLIIEEGPSEPGVDVSIAGADNAGEPIAQDGDVRAGHDSPSPIPSNQSPLDGDSKRPGGDTDNVALDGEFSESGENDSPSS